MNLHELLNGFSKSKNHRRNPRRMSWLKQSEVFEDRCLLTAGTGQFLGGQILAGFAAPDVALGDVDGDGDLDAFFANVNSDANNGPAGWTAAPNRVFLNNGGVFTDSGQTLGNEISLSVELGDLDGDGDLDAFVGNAGPDSIWLNDGSGNFTDSGLALGNGFSIGVELADLNGDGVLDIAVTNTDVMPGLDTEGAVWINQGVAPLSYTNTGSNLWGTESSSEIALGDVDGNGTIDAVVTQFSADGPGTGANRIFLNDGNGTFTDSGNTFATMSSLGVGLADFDGDNDLDIFIADDDLLEGDRVYINQGGSQGGTEGVFVDSGQRLGVGRYAVRVDIADFDGDGDPDVFVTPSGESPVSGAHVFINQGGDQGGVAGAFASNGQTLGVGGNMGVALGDIDGNGTIDAITADIDGNSRVWLNQPAPPPNVTFEDSGQLLGNLGYSTSYQAPGVALGDLDGDGDLDAFVVNQNSSLTHGPEPDTGEPNRVFLNNNGVFTDSGQTLGNEISGQVQLGDFDNDGDLDAFVTNFGPNELWLNDGNGTFTNSGQTLGSGISIDVSIGDVDGDGDMDAVVANATDGSSPGGEVWINQGLHTGTFVNSATAVWDTISAFGIDLGDVDGDGDLDAFVSQGENAAGFGGEEKLLLNQGNGTFVDSGQSLGASHSFGVVLEDFDSDGDLDAFVTGAREFPPGSGPDGVRDPNRYFVNMGGVQGGTEGVFGAPVQIFNDNQDQSRVAAADLDGDGDIDVFVANVKNTLNSTDGQNRVYVNQGGWQGGPEGTFVDNGQQLGNSHSNSVALGDVNGDGKIDAFVSNGGSPSRVWLNTSGVGTTRTIDVTDFERLETLGSLVAISGTEVDIAADETIEFDVDLEEDQLLSGFVDSFGGSSLANLTVEIVGLTGVLTAEEFVVLPPQSIETSGTYIVRVTSDAAVTTELVLILNATLEIPDSSDGNELEIDLSDIGGPASLGAVVALSNGTTTVPDIDEFTIDLTGLVGESIDVVLTGFEEQHYENQTLELLAPDGTTVLATGTATPVGGINATNLDLAIFDFEVPANGIYTARVTAAFDDVAYTLLVTNGITFDAEPNNDRINDALRSLTPNNAAQGHLDAATDANDFYEIELTAGQEATLFTDFTFDASVSPENTLNPDLEVFRPDGTSLISDAAGSIGGSAEVVFTAAETGTYVVRIGATAGSGEYLLQTEVTTPQPPPENRAPVANAGGPYRISENDSLALNASASSDPDGNPLTYRWDVNGDGSFDENITGVQPILTWSQLLALGIPAEASTRVIAVEVSDGSLVDTDQAFLTVESVDNPVTLSGAVSEGLEAAGTQITITATANRAVDGDQTVDVVVTGDGVTASDYALSNVQITIPAGQTTGAIVFTVLDDGVIETVETATVSIANPSAGIVLGATTANTVSIVSDDVATLTVTLDKAAISEDGDTATATVTRNGSNSEALVVNIGSNDRSEIAFPETVTIPDGESSVTFTVTGLSDTLLDGTRTASIVATSAGFVQSVTHIDVLDTDMPELRVELSVSTITEAGSVQVTVIRNTGGDGALGMIIVADSTEVSYPETVEIVNNTDRVTFTIHGLADGLVDGTQAIEISASHPGYVSIPTTLNVTDLDTAQLALTFDPGTVSENGGTTTGTVTRNTDTSEAVSVTIGLSSSDATAGATVVEIPAGQSSATFAVTGVDDAISNGSRDVTVTANATGFAGAAADITVADDDAVGIVSIVAIEDANEFDTVNGEFIIEMTTASSVDTIVNINVSGTAGADADYTALPSSVTIPAGLLSATLTVPVINDTDGEDEETVIVSLGTITGSGATVDPDQNFDTISIADNDRDLITPTATVRTLPLSTNTSTFTVTIDVDDPASNNGQPVSGVATYDLFVAVDGGAFTLYAADVPATQATVEFTPESNHRYWFKAVATDNAGNVEDSSPAAETNTYVGDVTAPETSVVTATANTATGEITLNISGTDAGNSGLDQFFVYVSIDGGPVQEIPASSIAAGTANNGTYSQTVTFQGFRDGVQHSYRFFTRGLDGAGNLEAASTGDVTVTETFAAPSNGLEANGIDVQNGETQRSYIRNVDVLFNDVNGLQDLIDNDRIQIERFDLSDNTPDVGTGSLVSPTSASVNGNAIKLNFGSTGLGGSGNTGNGFYRIAIDIDGDGLFDDAAFEFFRLWGDSNGDGEVTNADRVATEDVNGDGRVNSRDRIVYRTERGKKLHDDLFWWLDD